MDRRRSCSGGTLLSYTRGPPHSPPCNTNPQDPAPPTDKGMGQQRTAVGPECTHSRSHGMGNEWCGMVWVTPLHDKKCLKNGREQSHATYEAN